MTDDVCIELVDHQSKDRDSNEHTPSSVDDINRKELLWERREEKLLLKWCDDCEVRSKAHEVKGNKHKLKYAIFGIPSILIPIVLGGVAPLVPCHSIAYSIGMMCSGLFSGVSMFFNFGKKQQSHHHFSTKFFELSNEVQSELSKPKRHRIACDVYLEKIKQEYTSLVKNSPNL